MPSPRWCRPPSELCLGLRQWTKCGQCAVFDEPQSIKILSLVVLAGHMWHILSHFNSVQSYKGCGSELCVLQGQFWQSPQARKSFNSDQFILLKKSEPSTIVSGVRDQAKIFKASKKIPWGSKNKYLRHQQKIFPWNPLFSMALATVWRQNRAFLWYLHRFGSGASRP